MLPVPQGPKENPMAPKKKDNAAKLQGVFGSDVQPAMIELAEGVSVQLGDVVRRALQKSGLSADAWNDLPGDQREVAIAIEIDTMKTEAASASVEKNTRSEESGDAAGAVLAEPVKPQDTGMLTPDMSSDADKAGANPEVEASASGTDAIDFTILQTVRIDGIKFKPGRIAPVPYDQLQSLDAKGVIDMREGL
jgi:hypothetical protein